MRSSYEDQCLADDAHLQINGRHFLIMNVTNAVDVESVLTEATEEE